MTIELQVAKNLYNKEKNKCWRSKPKIFFNLVKVTIDIMVMTIDWIAIYLTIQRDRIKSCNKHNKKMVSGPLVGVASLPRPQGQLPITDW